MIEIEVAVEAECVLGEGPLWNAAEQRIYWTDIMGKRLHRFHPASGAHEQAPTPGSVGAFAFRERGGLVLAAGSQFALWEWGAAQHETIARLAEIGAEQRFNDGKVDARGRFWAGSMGAGAVNHLYRLGGDHHIERMLGGVSISNGIGWTPDNRTMIYTDTPTGKLSAFDFDLERGEIHNRRVFAQVDADIGSPDGLCVDAQGGVWCAVWDGWRVLHFDRSGALLEQIDLPVQRPTSCAFGGENLDVLYITSARDGLHAAEREAQPLAGALFAARVGVQGIKPNLFAG